MLNPVDALHGDLGVVSDGDVILALSYSGESEELLNLIPALKRFSVKIISLTSGAKSFSNIRVCAKPNPPFGGWGGHRP